jgi:predicted O-methyltransferase YrrM
MPNAEMEVLQIPEELQQMVALYRKAKPKRVLEIGCWDGGTLQVWLEKGNPTDVVAVDLEHRNADAYEEWRKPGTKLHLFTAASQDPVAIKAIQSFAPYDWVFIDGDHGESAVRQDVRTCQPLVRKGGLLVFHDISQAAGEEITGPRVLLEELRAAGFQIQEFIEQPGRWRWAHGIGVVQM